MSKQHLYFPTRLEDALSFLRSQRGLDQICETDNHTVIGYTDRALAVLQSVQSGTGGDSREVCLVVVEVDQEVISQIINGDMMHFGPCGRWRSDHVLELELTAQMLVSHGGRFSLQIVKS
jgi:hypothetical protein